MSPYFLLSILLGGIYGSAFQFWFGKNVKDVIFYVVVGIVGFGLGQALAGLTGWHYVMIGPLHVVEATLICWLTLFISRWLRIQ